MGIQHVYMNSYTGWWLTYPSEKYEFVSWGDSSEYMEKKVPNHHPDSVIIYRNWGVPGVPHQKKSRGGNFQLGNLGLDQKRIGFCQ
jgi:hypothetical protein